MKETRLKMKLPLGSKTIVVVVAIAIALVATPIAHGALSTANTLPSNAATVNLGIPFISGLDNGKPDVFHFNALVRPHDLVQLAIDNSAGGTRLHACVMPTADDFGYTAASSVCYADNSTSHAEVMEGQLKRVEIEYTGPTANPLLQFRSLYDGAKTYSFTAESVIQYVAIGGPKRNLRKLNFSLPFSVVFGDNTPASDGIAGRMYYKFPGQSTYALLTTANSSGGSVVFAGKLPKKALKKRVKLRFCVQQPGGTSERCAKSGTVSDKIKKKKRRR